MSEQRLAPSESAEIPCGEPPSPQPTVPLKRLPVQATIALLTIAWLAIIVWMGRTAIWPSESQSLQRPTVLLQININQADVREFSLLPNVGPVLAKRIVADRARNGRFTSIQDLARVHGIGQKTIAQLQRYCLVVPNDPTKVALAGD